MKANELRIGNYYQNKLGEVKQIHSLEIYYDEIVDPVNPTPIPLTEEWLLKFGFERNNSNNWRHSNMFGYIKLCRNKNTPLGEPNYSGSKYYYILNVHRLQNLYFALTGEELTIK